MTIVLTEFPFIFHPEETQNIPNRENNPDLVKHGMDVNRCQCKSIKRGGRLSAQCIISLSVHKCGEIVIQDSPASFACAFLSCSYLQIL